MKQRRTIHRAAAAALLAVLAGCSAPRYFDLQIESGEPGKPPAIDRVLRVEDIRNNEILYDRRMVVRKNDYRLQYLPWDNWAKTPGELIQDTVIQYYKNGRFFARVSDEYASVEPDLVMRIGIDALEMIRSDRRWFARLALDIELVDARTEKSVLDHAFDRRLEIRTKNARLLPGKISRMLKEELDAVVRALRQALRPERNPARTPLPRAIPSGPAVSRQIGPAAE